MKKKIKFQLTKQFFSKLSPIIAILCDQWSNHKVKNVMTIPATKKIDSLFWFPKKSCF